MRVKIIEGRTLPRWSLARSMSESECTRPDYNDIQAGRIVDVINDFGIWLVKEGYCEHVREDEE